METRILIKKFQSCQNIEDHTIKMLLIRFGREFSKHMSTMAQNTKFSKSLHSFHDNWSRDFWCPWKEYFSMVYHLDTLYWNLLETIPVQGNWNLCSLKRNFQVSMETTNFHALKTLFLQVLLGSLLMIKYQLEPRRGLRKKLWTKKVGRRIRIIRIIIIIITKKRRNAISLPSGDLMTLTTQDIHQVANLCKTTASPCYG